MTEPTDAELDAVLCKHWPAFSMQATLVRMWVRAAMRDAIAKWDTPPAEQQGITPETGNSVPAQGAAITSESGAVYAELPEPTASIGIDDAWHEPAMRDFADRTHALRMEQAAPKAEPGELHDHQILAITTAYEQGVGKGRQAHESGKEIANPYDTGYRCDLAWQYGYEEGKEQAERIAEAAPQQEAQESCPSCRISDINACTCPFPTSRNTAPQPAPALSDDVSQKTWALLDELEKLRSASLDEEDWGALNRRDSELRAALVAQEGA